ncbi:hypothetical protein TNCV_4862731 [Trichonephila clavipes]|nr:hypothetical protein TNCV_4862731 [Trichonephila clavipes]
MGILFHQRSDGQLETIFLRPPCLRDTNSFCAHGNRTLDCSTATGRPNNDTKSEPLKKIETLDITSASERSIISTRDCQ